MIYKTGHRKLKIEYDESLIKCEMLIYTLPHWWSKG